MKNRTLLNHLHRRANSKVGRITVLTGARQTGKTTLARRAFPDHAYISLDDPVTRPSFTALTSGQWWEHYPKAILDEVQKAPSLVESIKAVYDHYPEARYLLLGSSQILLLEKVRESLAGRASLVEPYPLTLPERLTGSWDDEIRPARLVRWLNNGATGPELAGVPAADPTYARAQAEFRDYLH
jgi:predicted AAA+ superfamily ATPase